MYGGSVFWRETMKPAKFLIFDGRVVLVLLPTFIHMRIWTVSIALITMMVFWWFDRKGISASSIVRFVRARFIGKKRTARGVFEERTAVHFGYECKPYLRMKMAEAARLELEAQGQKKSGLLAMFGLGGKSAPVAPPAKAMPSANGSLSLTKEDDA